MRLLLFCSVFFIVSVKCKFLMIKTESDLEKLVDSGVNDDVVKEMDHGQAVGSDYQDRDPIIEYWIHLHNKLERKCDKLEDLKKGKASLKDETKFCKAWKKNVWYDNFPLYLLPNLISTVFSPGYKQLNQRKFRIICSKINFLILKPITSWNDNLVPYPYMK